MNRFTSLGRAACQVLALVFVSSSWGVLTIANSTAASADDSLPKLGASGISLGGWTISVDQSGNLVFTSPKGPKIVLSQNGAINAPGAVKSSGNTVVTANRPIWLGNDKGWLNATKKIDGGGADHWRATPYWRATPLDGDSQLTIRLSQP
jgi:hypothetical protein